MLKFQSPRSGKFVSNGIASNNLVIKIGEFQSPRSGKFVSNTVKRRYWLCIDID